MRATKPLALATATVVALTLAGCSMMPDMPIISGMMGNAAPAETAVAQVLPTQGNQAAGTVRFTQHGSDTLVEVSLHDLSPGNHGIHIHEKGDCSAADGLSAGGHFNPEGMPHGAQDAPHHAGDLGNVNAGSDGTVNMNFHVRNLALTGDKGAIGRAIIIHAAADDLKTQPTGNSGKRIACGVISHP